MVTDELIERVRALPRVAHACRGSHAELYVGFDDGTPLGFCNVLSAEEVLAEVERLTPPEPKPVPANVGRCDGCDESGVELAEFGEYYLDTLVGLCAACLRRGLAELEDEQ